MRRIVMYAVAAWMFVAFLGPTTASAQEAASIVGVVRDSSGGVLPGVTVEASSPALIERVRSGNTDGAGRFAIINLRPGTYVVTFTLAGFRPVRREGVVLEGAFAATVNADLEVGAIEETVTVSGASPVVDLQSTQNQFVVNKEVMALLPATRSMGGGASLVPGVNRYTQGTATVMSVHGSETLDQRTYFDGMRIGQLLSGTGSQISGTFANDLGQEELVYDAGSQSAETAIGGVRMDSIPKEGGNNFSGAWRTYFSNGSLESDNVPDALRRYIAEGDTLDYSWNTNFTMGGPIRQNRLWFFGSLALSASDSFVANMYFPNGERVNRGKTQAVLPNMNFRLTGQLSPRNKLRASYYNQQRGVQRDDVGCTAFTGNRVSCVAPEAAGARRSPANASVDVKWTSTVTNRLLLEVAHSWGAATYRYNYQPEVGALDVQNQDLATGWRTVAYTGSNAYRSETFSLVASVSYVTGSHNIKVGLNHDWGWDQNQYASHANMSVLQFVNGVPNGVTVRNTPVTRFNDLAADSGIFAQDKWVVGRLTLFGGARFDTVNASYPDQSAPANPFVPERNFEGQSCQPCWNDWSIRTGASFDLFGTGKTAIKTSIGKFLAAVGLGLTSSLNPMESQSDTRTWRDLDGNRRAVDATGNPQWEEIGPPRNRNFGLPAGSLRIDPNLPRGNNWEETVSVQHELLPNVSVTGGYYRRQFYNLAWTPNLAVDPDRDFTSFTITGPTHPNLPGGGGEVITLYNLHDDKRGAVNTIRTWSTNNTRVYNGFEVSFQARLGRGFAFGGVTTERTATDACIDLANSNPNNRRFCKRVPPFRTLSKASAGYLLPYNIQVSGSFQARPGIPIGADYAVTSQIAGVPLTGGISSLTVDLIDPTSTFYDTVYTNDLSVSRTFRLGRTRIRGFMEIFNVVNNSTITTRSETFGPFFFDPFRIAGPRQFQFGAQIDF